MVASSVEIVSLPDQVSYPNTEDQPAITVQWDGGTGPFNVEYTWDDDPTFGNANGNRQTVTNNSVTSPDTAAPGAALADTSDGTTWYIKANVVDTDDSGELSDDHEFTYFDPIGENRYLYLLGNVGVAFHPKDEPVGGWGTGGTQGADGDNRDFNRYLYLLGNVGVGFTPTDDPLDGWGTGGTEGPDGHTRDDFDRFLYQLANVDTSQPCPFLFRLSSQTVSQGASLTVYGQGLVSDSSPTADSWDAEVRLYETTDLDGSFQVLAITDWQAGDSEDSITVSIPSNASSGFIAVVHTTTPTCDGSNFIVVNVLSVEADREAGWWVEIWNLRNSQKIITALPDVAEADIEHIPGDIGKGHILLPQNHPDIADIIDRTASPQVQRLVKVYQHNRFSYSFIPDDIEETYSEDGAKLARIYGEGQERMLRWGRALFKDFPASTTGTRTWLYGSSDNLLEWLNGEEDSLLGNGGFEDATIEGWTAVGTADIDAFTDVSRSGSYGGRVSPSALDDGLETTFTARDGERIFCDIHIADHGATKDKTFLVELIDSDDTVIDSDTVSPGSTSFQPVNLSGLVAVAGEHRLRVTQSAGTIEDYWWVDDAAAYAGVSGTYELTDKDDTLRLSRTNVLEGLHSLELVVTGDTGGLTIFAPVQPGQDYTFTLNLTGTAGKEFRAAMRLGGVVDSDQITLTGGNDTITLTGTAGATDTTVRIFLGGESAGEQTVYIDNSSLVPGFPAANPGEITLDVLEAIQDRGTLDFVTTSFTRTHDSSGLTWPEELPFEVDPKWTLWDLVDKFQGLGYRFLYAPSDWRGGGDTGWELSLFAPGNSTIDHSDVTEGPAILPGSTIEGVRPSSAMPIETVVYGEGPAGLWSVAELSSSTLTALERREGFISNQAARSATTVFRAASHRLETTSERGHQFTANMTDHGDPLPYFDFLPEDALRAHLPGNEGRDHVPDDTYRVAAVMSKLSGSGRIMSWQADFGNYGMYQERIQHLIVSRMLEREASENYRPGSGSVSSTGGLSGGDSTSTVSGVVPRHDHVLSDVVPDLEIPEDLDNLDDVSAGSPNDKDILRFNSSLGVWETEALSTTDDDALHDNVAGEIAAITEKATPVNADLVVIEDSEDSNNKKRAQLGNLPGGGGGGSTDLWFTQTYTGDGSDPKTVTLDHAALAVWIYSDDASLSVSHLAAAALLGQQGARHASDGSYDQQITLSPDGTTVEVTGAGGRGTNQSGTVYQVLGMKQSDPGWPT